MRLFSLAIRNVFRNRRRTTLALAGIGVGVATLLTIFGLKAAVEEDDLFWTLYNQVGFLQVRAAGASQRMIASPLDRLITDTPELRDTIKSVKGVVTVAPRVEFFASISAAMATDAAEGGDAPVYVHVSAVDPRAERDASPALLRRIKRGVWNLGDAESNVGISTSLALKIAGSRSLAISRDDTATWPLLLALDPDGNPTGEVVYPSFEIRSQTSRPDAVWMPLSFAQRMLRLDNRVTEYGVTLDSADAADVRAAQLDLQRRLGPKFEVQRWDELLPYLAQFRAMRTLIMSLVGLMIGLVVGLGIANAMVANVFERTREIGTCLALGMKSGQVARLLVWEGAALGFLGGLVAMVIALAFFWYFDRVGLTLPYDGDFFVLRPRSSPTAFLIALVASTLVCSVASLSAASRALKLSPVEALRRS